MMNSLVVRGGSPAENAFYIDNIETNKLSFGIEVKHLITDYDYFLGEYTDVMGNPVSDIVKDIRVSANKYAIFASHTWNPFSKLAINAGMRADYFSYNQNTH